MSEPDAGRPRVVLICHTESTLNRDGVARWLASFTDLAGIVLIEERGGQLLARVRRERKRIGTLRLLDVLAFRVYYGARLARRDAKWLHARLTALSRRCPPIPPSTEILPTSDPNSAEVEQFIRRLQPDLAIARCKRILRPSVFTAPRLGTYVLHPGVCPEYRNAHGAFWALARRDLSNVGLTLLKIDAGVDTGPVYGYFSCDFDEVRESHIVIMSRLVLDNLDRLRAAFLSIYQGTAPTIDTTGRHSAVWGQPWLTSYLSWKRAARGEHARPRP